MMTFRRPHPTALLAAAAVALATLTGCSSSKAAAAPHPQQSTSSQAQPSAPGPYLQPQRATSTPYKGDLTIFDYPDRENKLQIGRVMTLLKIHHGSNVADLGAGSGWFSVRAAKRVGPTGKIYAEDINPEATKYIMDRASAEKLANVQTVLDREGSFKLPQKSVDAALILKAYHEFAHPVQQMQSLLPALRPGALVGIIDRNGTGSGTDHGVPQATTEQEMDQAGYRKVAMYDFTKADGQDYFLIFTAK